MRWHRSPISQRDKRNAIQLDQISVQIKSIKFISLKNSSFWSNHFFVKLFNILMHRKLPCNFIKIIVNWYTKISRVFKWNGALSKSFSVCSGIRQDGILSPVLINIYADVLINLLRCRGLGCYVGSVYVGCILHSICWWYDFVVKFC